MILTGRAVDAEEANSWGPVDQIAEDPRERAVEMGAVIAGFLQETVRTDRQAVYDGLGTPLEEGLAIEGWHGSRAGDGLRGCRPLRRR